MSYQEKNISVSLATSLLILAFYAINVLRLYADGEPDAADVYRLWAIIIVLTIVVNIVATILTQIVWSIITREEIDEGEAFITDERDELIELRGTRYAYIVTGIGIFFSMLSLVVGFSALVMFNLLIVFLIVAEIAGDVSRLRLYRRGF